ncbi:hypothetical protein CANMA_004131 [Candida margitis]|uniref:uncharacterized protein n=1 Tax=Candida margitis TaxID=1775924 RepID=UPI002226FFDF|nr:uncharacterized protein CANMA_004131 [Candida margitis]KAI5959204.1 hypothetical protein CANMA_004131 [Candida margitis]
MSAASSHSRHTSSSSNYDNDHDYSAPVIKPKLESIETSSASSNKSPSVADMLPPSNLSDIESFDDRKDSELHVVNKDMEKPHDNDTTIEQPSPSRSSSKQNKSVSPAPSAQETMLSREYQTVSVKLSQLQDTSSLESLLAKPAHQQPANLSRASNRESMFSNISQYSGQLESSAQAIPVVLQRSDSTKIKYVKDKKSTGVAGDDQEAATAENKSINTVDSVDTSQILNLGKKSSKSSQTPDEDEDESDFDESSILMGKIPTTTAAKNLQLNPDKTFETNVEGAIPARSPRRPTSMLPPDTTSKDVVVPDLGDKAARRRTMHITDDLDQLMQDASSMSSFNSMKIRNASTRPEQELEVGGEEIGENSAVFDTTAHSDDSDAESHGPEVPSHRYSTGTSSTKMTPLLNKLAVEDDEDFDEGEDHSGHGNTTGNESDVITIAKRETSLPPRPSEENIRRARDVSANIQKQQQEQQESQHPITGQDHYYVSDENTGHVGAADVNDDDQYYDIDEPIQHPPRGKSVKSSIRRPARNITNTAVSMPPATSAPAPGTTTAQKEQPHSKKHKKKHKDKKAKSAPARGNELRPFSYKTLVSLLESMNGTIIGEEFNSLNIPIREKQLIEKIIDSLSRLTSDMILDEERYDVGLKRLEKALRVLEGFN